jgi:hypothetical protein
MPGNQFQRRSYSRTTVVVQEPRLTVHWLGVPRERPISMSVMGVHALLQSPLPDVISKCGLRVTGVEVDVQNVRRPAMFARTAGLRILEV